MNEREMQIMVISAGNQAAQVMREFGFGRQTSTRDVSACHAALTKDFFLNMKAVLDGQSAAEG